MTIRKSFPTLVVAVTALFTFLSAEAQTNAQPKDRATRLQELRKDLERVELKIKDYQERRQLGLSMSYEAIEKALAENTRLQDDCRNRIEATRRALAREPVPKDLKAESEYKLLKDHLDHLINVEYPNLVKARGEIQKNRLKHNADLARTKKEYEETLARFQAEREAILKHIREVEAEGPTKNESPAEDKVAKQNEADLQKKRASLTEGIQYIQETRQGFQQAIANLQTVIQQLEAEERWLVNAPEDAVIELKDQNGNRTGTMSKQEALADTRAQLIERRGALAKLYSNVSQMDALLLDLRTKLRNLGSATGQ